MEQRIADTLELVRRSHGGDPAALDELFGRYYPRVLRVVRLRLGRKLRRRVESIDVLQEVFGRAVRMFDRFEARNEASFINWLSKLAERAISDLADVVGAQRRDVDREVPLAATKGAATAAPRDPLPAAAAVIPLDALIRDEQAAILDGCLEQLAPAHREVLILRHWVGLSFAEIAEETARPSEGAARSMHAKAMRELTRLVRRIRGETDDAEHR